jgi:hypothetical protein
VQDAFLRSDITNRLTLYGRGVRRGKEVALGGKGPDTTEQEQTAGERSRDGVKAWWCCTSEPTDLIAGTFTATDDLVCKIVTSVNLCNQPLTLPIILSQAFLRLVSRV